MTISVWRYSHLALAVSSFIFIALASLTGIVLAFEPIAEKIQPYHTNGFSNITLAEALPVLREHHHEIIDLSIDENQFVIVKAIDDDGKNIQVYTNAKTGETFSAVGKESAFFEWVTALHRSLFLHGLGRFFTGLSSFLLFLIAISGSVLIIQRQRGFKRFFTKIVKEDFAQYYHVVLGRLSLIPILIIAGTGTYLSLVKFGIWPEEKISHQINFDTIRTTPRLPLSEFKAFKEMPLSKVKFVEFPFSDDVEDYFTVKLQDRELIINQYTGDVLSEIHYSKPKTLENLSLDLHTGRSSAIWAIILAIATINILFFIYSGFAMTLKRRSGRIKNKFKSDECRFIILVGSENGSTFRFAKAVHQQLIKIGEKSYLTQLSDYKIYPKAAHFIVMTSTYGLGDAPTNASKFIQTLEKTMQKNPIDFSVVGFGSHAYPDFCRFAHEVNNALSLQEWANCFLEIQTVDDKSSEDFNRWLSSWSQKLDLAIELSPEQYQQKLKPKFTFKVLEKSSVTQLESAFLIRLRPQRNVRFTSGDLLAIYPKNDFRERLYSIGKIEKDVQLSVKMHQNGLGSGYLSDLKVGDEIKANINQNKHFHFPKTAKSVIMISNGTGIAPFLGMIDQNSRKIPCHLYCGFRSADSFELYKSAIDAQLQSKNLSRVKIAYSRETNKQYVKDLLSIDADFVLEILNNNGAIMLCGSLEMQKDIIELLENICQNNDAQLSHYQSRNQILMDCY